MLSANMKYFIPGDALRRLQKKYTRAPKRCCYPLLKKVQECPYD